MKLYVALSCWIDLTDPEPNVTIQRIFSTMEKAESHLKLLQDESDDTWFGIRGCEVDADDGISLDTDDVDMELFC